VLPIRRSKAPLFQTTREPLAALTARAATAIVPPSEEAILRRLDYRTAPFAHLPRYGRMAASGADDAFAKEKE
jgi:hypothetical protein